jgi:hypothetical protein
MKGGKRLWLIGKVGKIPPVAKNGNKAFLHARGSARRKIIRGGCHDERENS